ncbi:unnamed protein product [Nippostrongylus brasiliensis]|uniref:Uncharacterized protein n=1 Tax=Nippostrongylus brasiliensis TaxID=27835 RepID=A0A0N4Y1P1_NIPBR|nr:unnamed protein product [Nippostrongylus brasiliensis]
MLAAHLGDSQRSSSTHYYSDSLAYRIGISGETARGCRRSQTDAKEQFADAAEEIIYLISDRRKKPKLIGARDAVWTRELRSSTPTLPTTAEVEIEVNQFFESQPPSFWKKGISDLLKNGRWMLM